MNNMNLYAKNFCRNLRNLFYFTVVQYRQLHELCFFQKNLLSAILPKGIVTKISRDFSLYTSNTFRELCSKCHDDVRQGLKQWSSSVFFYYHIADVIVKVFIILFFIQPELFFFGTKAFVSFFAGVQLYCNLIIKLIQYHYYVLKPNYY